jgi:glycerate dehydrogenase
MILTNKTIIDRAVMDACPNLKYIGLFATGYNVVDVEAAAEKGIVVCNAPAYSTAGVAQLAIALMLHFYSMAAEHDRRVHAGEWQQSADFCFYDRQICELGGKTLGLIGFGNIAKQVARIALAFDMKILVYNRTVYPEYENENLHFVSLPELYQQSDIISIHCPLFEETRGMINRQAIEQMKPNAILINTARGPIINEADLADALNRGRIAGAGVDVVSVEPIRADNPLLQAKNCVITPHIGWAGRESRERLLEIVYQNIKGFLSGHIINQVS